MKRNRANSVFDLAVIMFSGTLIGILFSFGGFNFPQLPFQLPFGNPQVQATIHGQNAFVFDFIDINTGTARGKALRVTAPQGVYFNVTEPFDLNRRTVVSQARTVYFLPNNRTNDFRLWFKASGGVWKEGVVQSTALGPDPDGFYVTITIVRLNVSIPSRTQMQVDLTIGREGDGSVGNRSIGGIWFSRGYENRTWTYPVYGICGVADFRRNETANGVYGEYFVIGLRPPQLGSLQFSPRYTEDHPRWARGFDECPGYGIVGLHGGVARAAGMDLDTVPVGYLSPGGMKFRTISQNRVVVEITNRR